MSVLLEGSPESSREDGPGKLDDGLKLSSDKRRLDERLAQVNRFWLSRCELRRTTGC